MLSLRLIAASAAVLIGISSAHADTFGLENSIGATPTFSVSSGTNTATFTSVPGNGFMVQSTLGFYTFNTGLLDNNFFGTDPLTISFASPVAGIVVIPFGILDAFGTNDSLVVTASNGQTATFSGAPNNLALGEPEGTIKLSLNSPINSLTLTGTNAFVTGDVSAVTPEPASLVMVATGLISLVLRRRKG